jgi:hypothetical protein
MRLFPHKSELILKWPLVAKSMILRCSPILVQRELEFSGVKAHVGGVADEPFMSEIGTLLPIALCGRNSL